MTSSPDVEPEVSTAVSADPAVQVVAGDKQPGQLGHHVVVHVTSVPQARRARSGGAPADETAGRVGVDHGATLEHCFQRRPADRVVHSEPDERRASTGACLRILDGYYRARCFHRGAPAPTSPAGPNNASHGGVVQRLPHEPSANALLLVRPAHRQVVVAPRRPLGPGPVERQRAVAVEVKLVELNHGAGDQRQVPRAGPLRRQIRATAEHPVEINHVVAATR